MQSIQQPKDSVEEYHFQDLKFRHHRNMSVHSSSQQSEPGIKHSQMSSTLREKLKRCGRYHPSTSSHNGPFQSQSANTSTVTIDRFGSPDASTHNHGDVRLNKSVMVMTENRSKTSMRKVASITRATSAANKDSELIKRRKLISEQSICNTVKSDKTREDMSDNISSNLKAADMKRHRAGEDSVNIEVDKCGAKAEVCDSNGNKMQSKTGSSCIQVNSDCQPNTVITGKTSEGLRTEIAQLEKILKLREEHIRKLKMVKMYREKNNLTELQDLIDTWREVSQRALLDLHELHPSPRPTLTSLVCHLQIDHELISFDPEEETFS